jgi:DNA mismatch repair protein MutL
MATDSVTDSDSIIRVMPDGLANKIAAGEVVQRPASVAKELLENAIDAGAGAVQLIVKDAGSTLVHVIDDGCGMSPSDAVRCFRRHATSKIQSVDDLERIRTLGFRGEALASIASVAQVELKTRRVEDDVGIRVSVDGGEIVAKEPCATPAGTSIAVRNLFYNVPARRNFLKTPATEFKHIVDTFQFIALAEPSVSFSLDHKGHTVYDLPAVDADPPHDRLRHRISDLLGEEHREQVVPVQDSSSYVSVRGFVAEPDFHRTSRRDQFLFVNGRYVKSRYLSHAVRVAYGELLPDGAFPFFALFLDLDPRRVDVNVHPTKAEVKFEDESGIYGFLRGAVRDALSRAQLTPAFDATRSAGEPDDEEAPSGETSPASESRGSTPRPFQPRDRSTPATSGRASSSSADSSSRSAPSSRSDDRSRTKRTLSSDPSPGAVSQSLYQGVSSASHSTPSTDRPSEGARSKHRPIWALHDTYLMTPTEEGMVLVDQRAAHARVLYERLLERTEEGHAPSQQLLFPETMELTPSEDELVDAWGAELRAMGYEMERLSGRTMAIRGVPADAQSGDAAGELRDLLDELETNTHDPSDRRKALAARLARRHAVPHGHALAADERRALLNDLFDCEMPYADPQGRPTVLRWSLDEIAHEFHR